MQKKFDFDIKELGGFFVRSKILLDDLSVIDADLTSLSLFDCKFYVRLRHLFVIFNNIEELQKDASKILIASEKLAKEKKMLLKDMDFFRKLRNLIGAHINAEVLEKTIIWEPYIIGVDDKREYWKDTTDLINLRLLEVAVNCYEENGSKKNIFGDELDFCLPKYSSQFFDHLSDAVKGNLAWLKDFIEVVRKELDKHKLPNLLEASANAGRVSFDLNKQFLE